MIRVILIDLNQLWCQVLDGSHDAVLFPEQRQCFEEDAGAAKIAKDGCTRRCYEDVLLCRGERGEQMSKMGANWLHISMDDDWFVVYTRYI